MASLLRARICPSCGQKALMTHCRSDRCLWVVCDVCHSFGTDDGKRWASMLGAKT